MKRTSVAVLVALGIGLLCMPSAMAGENRVNLLCTPDPAWCEPSSASSPRAPASNSTS